MKGVSLYSADFYRGEIERLTLALTQPVTDSERKTLNSHLDAARAHLGEVTGGQPVGFKW